MILHALAFGEQGSGSEPPRTAVVLLHGLFGRGRNLASVGRALAVDRFAVALDLRSHGDSPHGALALDDMARDVLDTIDQLGLGRAALLGHSLGGKVAMRAALLAPARIAALLVADIAPVAEAHGNAAVAEALARLPLSELENRSNADRALAPAIADPAVRAFLLANLDAGPTLRWRFGLHLIRRSIDAVEGWAALPAGQNYDGPTCFVRGERSDYLRQDHRPAIAALFPRATLEVVPDAGHWLHAEQPAVFNRISRQFLDTVDREAAARP